MLAPLPLTLQTLYPEHQSFDFSEFKISSLSQYHLIFMELQRCRYALQLPVRLDLNWKGTNIHMNACHLFLCVTDVLFSFILVR